MTEPDFIPDGAFTPDAAKQRAPAQMASGDPDFIPDQQFQSDDDKYGTLPQQALTGLEGVAKGVLGPVATAGEKFLSSQGVPGLKPEDQAGRQAANPIVHGGAEAAGFVGSAFTGTGEAALIGELGEGVRAASGLGKEGASLISKIAAGGIQTGSEMAALQAGDEASKAINEDPSQSLGTAAINVGLSGIMGGAGGAVIGAVSPLWKASMEKMGVPKLIDDAKAQYNFRRSLPNGGDVPSAVTEELGTRLGEVDNLRSQMSNLKGSSLARAMPEATEENAAKIDSQIQDISNKMATHIEKASDNAYLKGAVPKLAQDFQDFLEIATKPDATFQEKFSAIDDLKRALQDKSNYSLTAEDSALGKFTKGIARDLRLALEDNKVWGDAADVQAKVNAAIKASIDAEKDAASKFTAKSSLEGGRVVDPNKVTSLINQTLKGKAGLKTDIMGNYLEKTQELADTINKIHADAGLEAPIRLSPTPALDHTLGRASAGTNLGNWLFEKGLASVAGHTAAEATGAGLGSLLGHPVIGAIAGEKLLGPAFTSIAKPLLENASHSEALKTSLDYVVNVMRGQKALTQAAENFFKAGAEIVPKQLMPTVASREKAEKSLEYASNPDNISKVGGSVGHYMPDHATAIGITAASAKAYFDQLKPRQVQTSPLDKPSPIDKFKQAQYNRQLDIAQQPLLALKYAKQGTLQPQDVKTLNTLYPGLVKKMASESYEQMIKTTAEGKHIPYKQRVSLSLLMGQPLDSTMTPPVMQAVMMANAPKGPPAPPAGKTKKVSQSTSKTMERTNKLYATPNQARESDKLSG
jgi:hypothetical protein